MFSYGFVVIPFVTIVLSAWLDNEPVGVGLVLGGLLVLAYLVVIGSVVVFLLYLSCGPAEVSVGDGHPGTGLRQPLDRSTPS